MLNTENNVRKNKRIQELPTEDERKASGHEQ